MGLEGYGLHVGAYADFVLLQAADPIEAVRLRAERLAVVRRGRVIARTPERVDGAVAAKAGRRRSIPPITRRAAERASP